VVREHLGGLYDTLSAISDHLRSPLGRNCHWRTWKSTAEIVDALRSALLHANDETVGCALAQLDEEFEWRGVERRAA
jgi:hypothetical protein